ncbi:MAG: FMN-binding protein [Thermodesulfobacteriota bacterium]|nr:FMN-binding protein [Thermodesulfobacteriota bacterium]
MNRIMLFVKISWKNILVFFIFFSIIACASSNLELPKYFFEQIKLKDGTYHGKANLDWRNSAEVEVTIKGDRVIDIRILKHRHGPGKKFSADEIIRKILDQQSTRLDAISGATVTSNVITGAVQNAINKAR